MKLEVYTSVDAGTSTDMIRAQYDSAKQLTRVFIDCDIVTLGITLKVLQEKYAAALRPYCEEIQERIRTTIEEALKNEEY